MINRKSNVSFLLLKLYIAKWHTSQLQAKKVGMGKHWYGYDHSERMFQWLLPTVDITPAYFVNLQAPEDRYYRQNNSAVWSEKPFKSAAEGQDMTSYQTDKLQVLYCNI